MPSLKNERYRLGTHNHVDNVNTCLFLTHNVLSFHTYYENGGIALFFFESEKSVKATFSLIILNVPLPPLVLY